MSRVQLALNSAVLDETIAFYSKVFGTEPSDAVSACAPGSAKVRAGGPGGEPWEIYVVLGDADTPVGQLRNATPGESACCSTRPELVGLSTGARS